MILIVNRKEWYQKGLINRIEGDDLLFFIEGEERKYWETTWNCVSKKKNMKLGTKMLEPLMKFRNLPSWMLSWRARKREC